MIEKEAEKCVVEGWKGEILEGRRMEWTRKRMVCRGVRSCTMNSRGGLFLLPN